MDNQQFENYFIGYASNDLRLIRSKCIDDAVLQYATLHIESNIIACTVRVYHNQEVIQFELKRTAWALIKSTDLS